jgi:hypothetical protein
LQRENEMITDTWDAWELEGLRLVDFTPGSSGSWDEPAYPPEADWIFTGLSTHVTVLEEGEGLPKPGDLIGFRRTLCEDDDVFWEVDLVGMVASLPTLLEDGTIEIEVADGEGYWTGLCPPQSRHRKGGKL